MNQEKWQNLTERLVESGKAAKAAINRNPLGHKIVQRLEEENLSEKLQHGLVKGKETLSQVQEALVAKFDQIVDRDTFKM